MLSRSLRQTKKAIYATSRKHSVGGFPESPFRDSTTPRGQTGSSRCLLQNESQEFGREESRRDRNTGRMCARVAHTGDSLVGHDLPVGFLEVLDLRKDCILELRRIADERIGRRNATHRSIEPRKTFICNRGG